MLTSCDLSQKENLSEDPLLRLRICEGHAVLYQQQEVGSVANEMVNITTSINSMEKANS